MPPDDREGRAAARLDQVVAQQVRQDHGPTVPAAPADIEGIDLAFENEAYRYAAEWLAAHKSQAPNGKPFALVLSRSISQDETLLKQALAGANVQQCHGFRSQKLIDVEGSIIVTTMNLEYALIIKPDSTSKTQQLFDVIKQAGMADRNIAAFEPPYANLILQRKGLGRGSSKQQVSETSLTKPWSIEQLEEQIERFHNDHTRTPNGVIVPWADPSQGITGDHLEIRISRNLAYYLDHSWQRGSVLSEPETHTGRMDIFITAQVLEPGVGPCVIEVKVLRSHRMKRAKSGKRVPASMQKDHAAWWGRKGVIQASLYRYDKSAPNAYLCSFDARSKETALPTVAALANEKKIRLKNYFMYRSTTDLQNAELAKSGG